MKYIKTVFLLPLFLGIGVLAGCEFTPSLKISANKDYKNVEIGDELVFSASYPGKNLHDINWSVDNTSLATIDIYHGDFKALSSGTVRVSAVSESEPDITAYVNVNIIGNTPVIDPSSITILGGDVSLSIGQLLPLEFSVEPSNANRDVTWSSSNDAIVTVSESGMLKGVAAGVADITITSNRISTVKHSVSANVIAPTASPTALTIRSVGDVSSIDVNQTLGLYVTGNPVGSDVRVDWSVEDSTIATINNSTAVLTAKAKGTTKVIATSKVTSTMKAEFTITVNEVVVPPTSIALVSANGSNLTVGQTSQLTPTVLPSTTTNKNVTYTSSNSGVLEVNSTGLVTAKSQGTAIITATSAASTSVKGTLNFSVRVESTGDGYYKPTSYTMEYNDFLAHWGNGQYLQSTGNQRLLIVPVQFKNSSYTWDTTKLNKIEKAFFGASNETGWESVASFYNKSSYGQLSISGEVAPVLTTSFNSSTAASYGDSLPDRYVSSEFYAASTTTSALTQRNDLNNDGFIDATIFVYAEPFSTSEDSNLWAWVWNIDNTASSSKPRVSNYMWVSYTFINEGYGSNVIDAHTYIHEMGHILGIDDYYSYGQYQPAGTWEMQDANVLDQNMYSKLLKGWSYPYVVDGTKNSTTITIGSAEATGDSILIKNNWNGSIIDEYLLLELYTPTGLNYKDAIEKYSPRGSYTGYTIPGIKLYHIDSRGCEVNNSGNFVKYITSANQLTKSNAYYGIAHSNIASDYALVSGLDANNFKLLHLLESGGSNTFKNGAAGNDFTTLFRQGMSFQASSTFFNKGTKFNDGSEVGYRISVDSLSTSSATITITKL